MNYYARRCRTESRPWHALSKPSNVMAASRNPHIMPPLIVRRCTSLPSIRKNYFQQVATLQT